MNAGSMAAARAERQSRSAPAVVLVVEDEVLVRCAIALDLSDSGYEVIEAADAVEALAVLEDGYPVDLVFSDIQMPGRMDGLALCRQLRERYPHVAIILTSAHGPPTGDLLPAGHRGADPVFIPKPYLAETVLAAVRKRIADVDDRNGSGTF